MYSQVEGGDEGMKQLKAVVLDKKGSTVTILAADGSFQKVRYRRPVEIGAEIEIAEVQQRQPLWRIMASAAAVFLLALIGSLSWSSYQGTTAVAMISVDINPRLQLTIDQQGRVLQFESLNPDAERVLAGLQLKGEPWNQALTDIIEQSVTLHYLNTDHSWVLVGYSPVKAGNELPKGVTSDDIVQRLESAAQAQGLEPKIAVYQLSAEDQTKANKQGLTLGEYALMNTAQDAGIHADANNVQNTDERVKLLEQPQVQKQMNKENQIKGIPKNQEILGDGNDPGSNANINALQSRGNTSGNQPKAQPGNSNAKPVGSSQGDSKQDRKQEYDEQQGKTGSKETGDQGKPMKSKSEEDNARSENNSQK